MKREEGSREVRDSPSGCRTLAIHGGEPSARNKIEGRG